jgi:TfoX/Sxy family transcriptional regulator of competence genes
MANDYRERLAALPAQARPGLADEHSLTFKSVFGAIAGYVDSRIFVTCGAFGLALRLPPETLADVLADGAEPLRYFPKGHVKKQYAVLPPRILDDSARLASLLAESVAYAMR